MKAFSSSFIHFLARLISIKCHGGISDFPKIHEEKRRYRANPTMSKHVLYLGTWDCSVEGLSGLFDQVCQSMVLWGALLHRLFNVNVDPIHKLSLGQVDLLCYPRRPVLLVHNVGEMNVTFTKKESKKEKKLWGKWANYLLTVSTTIFF